jgi:hypothetical protein
MEDQYLQETLEAVEATEPAPEVEAPQEQAPEQPKGSNQENLRNLRQKAEERDYYFNKYQEYQSSQHQQQPKAEQEEPEPKDDDLVEWGAVQKRFKKLEKKLEEYERNSTAQSAEARIQAKHPDYYSVVNEQTIAALRQEYPEIAASISSNQDLYSKAASAYTLIKKLGIAQSAPDYSAEKSRVQANHAKPRPVTSIDPQRGESPLSQANRFANGLTPDLKKQLQAEMQAAIRAM